MNAIVIKLKDTLNDIFIRNFNFDCVSGVSIQGGILLDYSTNITMENLTANKLGGLNMGAGIIVAFHCERLAIRNTKIYRNENTIGQGSLGRHFNFANCLDVSVWDSEGVDLQSCFCFNESYCERLYFYNTVVRNEGPPVAGAKFFSVQGSEAHFQKTAVQYGAGLDGVGHVILDDNGGTAASMTFRDLSWIGAWPVVIGGASNLVGLFQYNDGTNSIVIDFDNTEECNLSIPLSNVMYTSLPMEFGFVTDMEVWAPTYIVGLSGLYFGTNNNLNHGLDISPSVSGGNKVRLGGIGGWNSMGYLGTDVSPYGTFANMAARPQMLVSTAASGVFGHVELRYRIARIVSTSGPSVTTYSETQADAIRNKNGTPVLLLSLGTATAGQTTFTVQGGYAVGRIFPFVNGIMSDPTSYTAATNKTIVFGVGRTAGDVVTALVFF
jgi:hypothetical protein